MEKGKKIKRLTRGAIIGALYAALTFLLAPISFGAVQCRVSEALCILPLFTPDAIWGLFAGCLITNIYSGSIIDIVCGSLTTLLAAFLTYKTRKHPAAAMAFPCILNGIVVGGYLSLFIADGMPVALCMLAVAAGEAVACYGLGMPIYYVLKKKKFKL